MVSYPKDWEIRTLGKCGEFISGVCFPLENQGEKTGEIPFFKVSDFNSSVNQFALLKANNYVTRVEAELLSTKFIPKHSIVFAKIGAAIKLERKRLVMQNSLIDNNMMAFVTFKDYSIDFLKWFFESVNLSDYIEVTALPSLKSSTLKKIEVWIPNSKSEQQAIADALTAFDTHINNLSKLIEKKKMIRDGAVEDLVSGKRRLAGFSGKWEEISFSKVISELKSGLSRELRSYDVGLQVIRANNLDGGKLYTDSNMKYWYRQDPKGAKTEYYFLRKGDILINFINSETKMGTAAMVEQELKRETIYTTNILRMRIKHEYDPKYIFYITFTERYKKYIKDISKVAVNQASFTTVEYKQFTFNIPTSLTEQQAIADILTAMDKEITDLEEEKEKYIALKAGAMDDLLTGKIRLA